MNPPKKAWSRLVAAARSAPDGRDVQAPFGFSTRVAALAMATEGPLTSLIERFSLRAMILACTLAVVVAAANYSHVRSVLQNQAQPSDDPIAEMVDIAS